MTSLNSLRSKDGYALSGRSGITNPIDGQTLYWGSLGLLTTTADLSRLYIPIAGTITKAYIWSNAGTAGTSENWDCAIRLNNSSDTLVQTVGSNSASRSWVNTGLSIAVAAGDYIEFKMANPDLGDKPADGAVCGADLYSNIGNNYDPIKFHKFAGWTN